MRTNFLDISYLENGNPIQQRSYDLLTRYRILSLLSSFDPVLVGTIPIGINVEGSDLDIVCEIKDIENFQEYLSESFSQFLNFSLKSRKRNLVVCNFYIEEMMIEIYASDIPSVFSNGYRHMLIEDRILNLLGDNFKDEIIQLKCRGLKTEPAFGRLLGLEVDPYEELLKLENYPDSDIIDLWETYKRI